MKKSTKVKSQTIENKNTIVNVMLSFELCDWSETLTYNQLMDTLFIVGQFINNKETAAFSETDTKILNTWFSKNDISKFLRAKETALLVQAKEFELEEKAKDIMSYSIRKPLSH